MMSVWGVGLLVLRRLAVIFCLAALGVALDGCTKCGPLWDDWLRSPKSCKSDNI
jgi:hypothetical protein